MVAHFSGRPLAMSIAAVERDTGLSKDTLRVWERRYEFPRPERDRLGERSYPLDQVERLRAIKRLLDLGHRPGRTVALPAEDLERLSRASGTAAPRTSNPAGDRPAPDLATCVDAIHRHDTQALRQLMARRQSTLGLGRFVLDVVAPLNLLVGEAWMQGRLEVFEEHLYTEAVQVALRNGLQALPGSEGPPRVLLATVAGEPHGLGLLMAEALLALEGCQCSSLGVQTPVWDIARAATLMCSDIVALSFTACMNPQQIVNSLTELSGKLPAETELWAGGSAPVLQRRPVPGVRVLAELEGIAPALDAWHRRRSRRAGDLGNSSSP